MLTIPEEILIRNIQRSATEDETRRLNEWLRLDKKNVELYSQMEEIWHSRSNPSREAIREGWNRLHQSINGLPQNKALPRKKPTPALWIRYAAAIFAGALISSAVWFGLESGKVTETELIVQNVVNNHTGVQPVRLPDGSEVYIQENTKLTYPEEFKGGKRIVGLEGSAYFQISKNPAMPFIVNIDNVAVEVTGTEFFIESPTAGNRSVTLISGGVNVSCTDASGNTSSAKLNPGQAAGIINNKIEVTETNTNYYVAWKDGTYRFTDEPLEKIASLVARRLNLDIQIAPTLKTKRFTGRITSEENIRDILATIQKSYPIKYKIEGKEVRIEN